MSIQFLRGQPPVNVPPIPLHCMFVGQKGRIDQVLGDANHVHRLRELGLRDGVEVEMLQPGTPCIVRLAGHKLCFRADEVTSVLVRAGV